MLQFIYVSIPTQSVRATRSSTRTMQRCSPFPMKVYMITCSPWSNRFDSVNSVLRAIKRGLGDALEFHYLDSRAFTLLSRLARCRGCCGNSSTVNDLCHRNEEHTWNVSFGGKCQRPTNVHSTPKLINLKFIFTPQCGRHDRITGEKYKFPGSFFVEIQR